MNEKVWDALWALVDAHDQEPRIVTETEWANARVALGRRKEFNAYVEANCTCGFVANPSQAMHTEDCPC